jgi:hypothetical protein
MERDRWRHRGMRGFPTAEEARRRSKQTIGPEASRVLETLRDLVLDEMEHGGQAVAFDAGHLSHEVRDAVVAFLVEYGYLAKVALGTAPANDKIEVRW